MDRYQDKPMLAICVATYHRSGSLQRLLSSLANLQFKKCAEPDWLVVIVDNDVLGSAEAIVEGIRPVFPKPIRYAVEPEQGIASARNKAVSLAADCDFIAFVDDDEEAGPNWLDELLFVQNQTQADLVSGPVLPKFEQSPPGWVVQGGFFNRRRHSTGQKIEYAATGNVLIKERWLKYFDGPFDVRLNLTGGSDTLFSIKIFDLGAIGVWADDALVYEYNPPERLRISWLVKRAWRIGLSLSTIDRLTHKSIIYKTKRSFIGLFRIIIGLMLFIPASILWGFAGLVRILRSIARGAGEIFGLFGVKYEEYK